MTPSLQNVGKQRIFTTLANSAILTWILNEDQVSDPDIWGEQKVKFSSHY